MIKSTAAARAHSSTAETRPLRVLMTADAVGGVWSYAVDLASALAERGVEILLAVMGRAPSGEQQRQARAVPGLRLEHRPGKLEWMHEPWQDVDAAGDWLLALAETWQADLVHLNGYAHGALTWPCPTLVAGHSCVLSWWEAVHAADAPGDWNRYRQRVRRGLQAASGVVCPSRAMLSALQRHYGPLERATVIYNGADRHVFRPAEKHAVVFAAGRLWDPAKNVRTLDLIAHHTSWPVRIAGDARGPESGVHLDGGAIKLGQLERSALAAELSRADIYVHPARYEPFGLCVLEAALSGCALLLSDIPSLRELWQDAALFVDSADGLALSQALERLIDDEPLRCTLAATARRRGLELSLARQAEGYRALYRQLLGSVNLLAAPAFSAALTS